jgi:sarcosine oxidase
MFYDVIVLGAGINGLSTAYQLARKKVGKLAVLEQFELGHVRGSSHGMSRITRSSYHCPKYIELIRVAHSEDWPQLAQQAQETFLHPTPGLFFGPGNGPYLESLKAIPELAEMIQVLEPKEARRVAPMFSFPDSEMVIHDLTCAVVAARQVMRYLGLSVSRQAEVVENCRVQRIERGSEEIVLRTSKGPYSCGRLVVTGGGWLGSLFPEFAPKLQVAHQDVGYFSLQGGGDLPVWVYCPREGDSFYGLPEFGRPGVKVARHRTGAQGDDPGRSIPEQMPAQVKAELEDFVSRQFVGSARCVGYEACLYTNTLNEDFVLDHHPQDERIVIGSACSGHGFKFGPLTGRLLCELLLDGRTSVEPFERHRECFRLSRHGDWPARS